MAGLFGSLPAQTATQQHFYGSSTTDLKGPAGNGTDSVWVPEIFSKSVLMRFRRESVAEAITNTDYFGEISNFGDSVRIIKEPNVTISSYSRGEEVTSTDFQDSEHTLVLDQAYKFQFQIDDIEQKLAHVNWEGLASNAATYNMKMAYDINVLTYFKDTMLGIQLANKAADANLNGILVRKVAQPTALTSAADKAAVETELKKAANIYKLGVKGTSGTIDPLNYMSQLALYLDKLDVPEEGRFIVVPPEFVEQLSRVDSKLMNTDYGTGPNTIRNGLVAEDIRGFKVYKTNNAPKLTGGAAGDATHFMIAGHTAAVATANSIVKTEKYRSQKTFADVVRGLHVFGRALVREDALVGGYVAFEAVA
ncbi:coat protein [Pseudoalteromonas phage vB_PtuP_Slicky01]|nr:coat protein [Pseudoalteromonas phage vB_PtuP_Slicky01]